jgi:FAD binding domain
VVPLRDNSPFIRKADTLTELAKKMEVDVGAFLATIERYNGAYKQGLEKEPEFGKPLKASKPFDTPPYYAVQIFPLARKNFGGAKTDLQCRVLDKHFDRSSASTPRVRSRAWPAATLTAAPDSKAPCWARRSSAGGSPAAGPPMQGATIAAFPASRTAVELGSRPGHRPQLSPTCPGPPHIRCPRIRCP